LLVSNYSGRSRTFDGMGRRAAILSCKQRWFSPVAIGEKVTLAAWHLELHLPLFETRESKIFNQ
jgi:hypothetical protein